MSFTRRIIDSARSGLSSFFDRVAVDDTPLSHVDEHDLKAELEARLEARERSGREPGTHPRARGADSSAEGRALRKKLAAEREKRVRAERETRTRAERAARDEAYRRMKEEAARQARTGGPRPGAGGAGTRTSGSRFGGLRREDPKIAEAYRTLNLSHGAEFAEVKSAYRKLMRRYHPDLHGANPKKQKAATELTMRITTAYNTLEEHLTGGRKKS